MLAKSLSKFKPRCRYPYKEEGLRDPERTRDCGKKQNQPATIRVCFYITDHFQDKHQQDGIV
jgi:hypothetical protein